MDMNEQNFGFWWEYCGHSSKPKPNYTIRKDWKAWYPETLTRQAAEIPEGESKSSGGFPLWGALSFIISGSLTVVSAKKQTKSLLRKNIGANTLSTLVSFVGICILSYNLTKNFHYDCEKETACLGIKSIAIGLVIVLMILTCLQFLISLPLSMLIYDVDDGNIHWISVLFCWKSPSESPYQDLLPQTSIYQELEYKEETPSCYPTDTSKQI
ncbi:high affinity immunoglobulin epsilon receptor subunit beta-like [Hyaena hyaena]|uniref:high affinity immunoglobulin epsilon receptor subunit beta-like n=1 Tax=Hyaena hyaena TaxID=95912 RepID=UPI0019249582|nr:high affinity immunoglobulin epsilon receptor subunit beta-like [Hyaena hyaena]